VKQRTKILIGAIFAGLMVTALPAVSTDAYANETIRATTGVNVRSGPGTTYQIIGSVASGATIEATGPSVDNWTPVIYNGQAAYVCSEYFTGGSSASAPAATVTVGAAGTATTTADLNVRAGAGTNYARLDTLPYGTVVSLTGNTSNGFAEINYLGGTAWVSTSWLSGVTATSTVAAAAPVQTVAVAANPVQPDTSVLPVTSGQMRTTSDLNFRTGPGTEYSIIHVIPNGTLVDVTATEQNGFIKIVRQNQAGWVSRQYLAETVAAVAPVAPAAPATSGTLYTTDYLNVRSAPAESASVVAVLSKGTAVSVTGQTSGRWTEIVYQGASRWVAGEYLSSTAPVVEPTPALTSTPDEAKAIARQQVAAKGWGDDQYQCLVELWTRESGWRMNAENPYSGAYGIPQALPADKMASAGADWKTNAATQIAWGLGYIQERYGTPCSAWGFFQSNNWY
jgi:uncharacterized protein YgiM (DUF1202 family)